MGVIRQCQGLMPGSPLTVKANALIQAQQGDVIDDALGIVFLMYDKLLNAQILDRRCALLSASLLPAVSVRGDTMLAQANFITASGQIEI